MHGLINRAIQCFLRDSFGADLWTAVAREAGLAHAGFEPMLHYDPAETEAVLDAATRLLDRPRETLMEDLGTYLVSHANSERLRRLLRFSGGTFGDFLQSLEDLPGRGRMALPDLDVPALDLIEDGADHYRLICRSRIAGAGHVMVGLLRAMADDYGALVLLDHRGTSDAADEIGVQLLDSRFAEGRRFELSGRMG